MLAVLSVSTSCSGSDRPVASESGQPVSSLSTGSPETAPPQSDASTQRSVPHDSTASAADSDPTFELPALSIGTLQEYPPGGQELVWSATQELVADCMRNSGFKYTPIPPENFEASLLFATRVSGFPPAIAASVGYHTTDTQLPVQISDALQKQQLAVAENVTREENPAFVVALEGPEGGAGCVAEAYYALFGDRVPATTLFSETIAPHLDILYKAIENDPSYIRALDNWRTCMNSKGFDFRTPTDARNAFFDRELSSDEISTATADAECRLVAQIFESRYAAESRALQGWLESNPGFLETLHEAQDADIEAAKTVLS